MRISHENKFIFFSNPKTGSESLREMLTPYSDVLDVSFKETTEKNPFYSHIRPVEVKKIFTERGFDYDSYYKIVCVRNPFNRLVSLYEMIFRKWPVKPPFYLWLKSTSPSGKGGGGKNSDRWRMYGTYSLKNFISDENGTVLVDQIIQLERFKEEIPQLFKELNLDYSNNLKVVKKNVRKRKKEVKDYYSEKSRQLVYDRYAWEIDKFGYAFPE
ncbi:MAG: sulfotransferase family 2 domain-containing protein [Flavobacteriaceae bacterium]|nr:sulfotransferase family 2 domain-containing protein [Bacteroidia bacterium]NNK68969.1 sulfotransferase family 2 domain-containing protein [Flavobacteriaceae bacterium]NNL81280.1 sulfotransferase family 2 domain-containing protein [Flavobacteriaceae bacterium]